MNLPPPASGRTGPLIDPRSALRIIDRELADRKLHSFMRLTWSVIVPLHPFVDNWHLGCIAEHLEAMTVGQIRKLIINMPPRSGKSLVCSVFWFGWVWLRDPSSQWIFSSYKDTLAERDSDRCRDLVKSQIYRESFAPQWEIKAGRDSVDSFYNTLQGARICTTPDGAAAGLDADYQVCDDANNVRERRFPKQLEKVGEWWNQGMSTRGNDPLKLRRLIVQQRIAERDLTGIQIYEDMGYEQLVLPAEYEPHRYCFSKDDAQSRKVKDPIIPTSVQIRVPAARDPRTKEGELLWPERFTAEAIADLKRELKSAAPGQLQQRPNAEAGTVFQVEMFRKFRMGIVDGEIAVILYEGEDSRNYRVDQCRMFQTCDTAQSKKSTADYTVVMTLLLTPDGDLLVYHIFRERLEIPYQFSALVAMRHGPIMWKPETNKFVKKGKWPRPLIFQAVEEKNSGYGLIQQGRATGNPFKVLKADHSKEERAGPVSTMYCLGKVFHHMGAAWLGEFENELLSFPGGAHDDMVDCLSYGGYVMGADMILQSYLSGDLISDTSEVGSEDGVVRLTLAGGEVFEVDFSGDE